MNILRIGASVSALVLASSVCNFALAADASASLEPGPYKMVNLGQGSVPAQGPIIHLTYDKQLRRYAKIDRDALQFPATVSTDCHGHDYKGTNLNINGKAVPFNNQGLSKTSSGFAGTKIIYTEEILTLNLPTPGLSDPVALCNMDLDVLVSSNKHGVAQKGWSHKIDLALPVEFGVTCSQPDKSKKVYKDAPRIHQDIDKDKLAVWVHCGPAAVFATSSPDTKPTVTKAGVQSAKVWVNPSSQADYHGECPATLNFGGEIAFVGSKDAKPSNVRYRYRTKDGDESPIFSTEFQGSASKNIHFWKNSFGDNEPGKALAAPGAGSGSKTINSWVRLEVLGKDDKVISSDQTNVKISCEPPPPNKARGIRTKTEPDMKPGHASIQMAGQSDLVIEDAKTTPRSPTTLRVKVTNQGTGASAATQIVLFFQQSGQVLKPTAAVPALAAGASAWVNVSAVSALADADKITLRVDDPSVVNETNEGNNSYVFK